MAEEREEGSGGGSSSSATADPPGSIRLPLTISAVLIALFLAGAIAFKKEAPKPFKTVGARAVVLPAADRPRSVVVPPCSPPTVITAANASTQIQVPGAVAVGIPQGAPPRTVVIPRCTGLTVPSAAFVLGPGKTVSNVSTVPKGGDPVAFGIKNQVTVPGGSPAVTIVAAPCQGKANVEKTTILKPAGGSGGVAIAPGC